MLRLYFHHDRLATRWAHIGWLMFTKNSTCLEAGKKLVSSGGLDDLKAQPLVRLQHKYYGLFFFGCAYLQPFLLCSLWGDGWNGLWVAGGLPLMMSFESTMFVNSLAHMWGEKWVSFPFLDNPV